MDDLTYITQIREMIRKIQETSTRRDVLDEFCVQLSETLSLKLAEMSRQQKP